MKKFKAGDKVRIKKEEDLFEQEEITTFTTQLCGKTATIKAIHQNGEVELCDMEDVHELDWNWVFTESMFELAEEKPSPIQYMLDYYGVEAGEEFELDGKKMSFLEGPDGEIDLCSGNSLSCNNFLHALLNGNAKVKKLPWNPKSGDTVWSISISGNVYKKLFLKELPSELALLKLGWIFPTEKEAMANADRVMAEMKEFLGNNEH